MDSKSMELSWESILSQEKQKVYFKRALAFVEGERVKGKIIYPSKDKVFNAFKLTSFSNLKVVILGQDPYHGAGQAHGLCFSVPSGILVPPSLKNIFKELQNDLGIQPQQYGNLESWANQGVFLLNSILTVEEGKASSHSHIGWQEFTDTVITKISEHKDHVVFILWGNYAKTKIPLIDVSKHTILTSAHPSPLSAYNGFFGSKPFSLCNKALSAYGIGPIVW